MAGPLVGQALGAIGSLGMNTQTDPNNLPPGFATLAINCFADEAGRTRARPGATQITSANTDLGSAAIERCYRHEKADGTAVAVLAGNGRIFTSDGTTLTSRESGHASNRWQFASLNGKLFAAQSGHSMRYFDETTWAVTTMATPSQPDAIFAAYGRLWAVKGGTLYWSDLLDGTNFTTGASGSLDLQKTHTGFRDTAVAVSAFGGQIIVFCRRSLYVLGLAEDLNPNNSTQPIYLRDFIPNIGCAARDTVVNIGDDVVFLADDGLRSLSRSLMERQGPAPMSDLSALNKQYVLSNLLGGNSGAVLTAAWNPSKAWYVVFAPTTAEMWLFDFGQRVPGAGTPRMFIWQFGEAYKLYCALAWTNSRMHYGGLGGMFTLDDHVAGQGYSMVLATGWLSFGSAERLDVLKRVLVNLTGGSGQTAVLKWYVDYHEEQERSIAVVLSATGTFAEYNVSEFNIAEFSGGAPTVDLYRNIGGAGRVFKFKLEFPVGDKPLVLNAATVFFKQGRIR